MNPPPAPASLTVLAAAGSAAGQAGQPGKLEQDLLENWARQPWRVPVPVSVAAGFIAWLPSGPAPLALRLGWVGLVLAVLLLRWWTIRLAACRVDWPLALRFNAVCVLSGLGGVASRSQAMCRAHELGLFGALT